jgi:hypothetical protein
MFTSWVLDQQDRDDTVGKLAKVMWDDYNAGCASMFKDPVAWKNHFESVHRKQAALLMDWLSDTFVEYCTSLDTRTNEF